MEQQTTGALAGFRDYLCAVGYSAGGVRMLAHCMRHFFDYRSLQPGEVKPADIVSFYDHLQVRPLLRGDGVLSGKMVDHYLYSLRVFFDWLQAMGASDQHPMSGLQLPRLGAGKRLPLSVAEITALFAAAYHEREDAALHLLYSCGLRRSEAVALEAADVWPERGVLYVRRGKGSRRRVVPLASRASASLSACLCWLSVRLPGGSQQLLVGSRGQAMTGDRLCRLVRELGERAGLEAPVTPHRLRHSIATHLLARGMALEQVRDFLGHRHADTTQIYAHYQNGGL
ncbi:tyrosine-type recombinase/integrase [Chitinophaga rhizosphaerae]|uniref:tyrosine-type recombinase/integrase n=1 Tax=Chitinophaga rhizosphaerae TaxID=1864947 RepID=UPI000F7FDCB8|nr:tyrosine-type recombinase/integrase [Chitinophaga rhizosphaerae]